MKPLCHICSAFILGAPLFVLSCGDTTKTGSSGGTTASDSGTFTLSSESLPEGKEFPSRYVLGGAGGCGGENVSPQVSWKNPPADAKSFAITLLDKDASNFVHWVAYNIPATATSLSEGTSSKNLPLGVLEGPNDYPTGEGSGKTYGGPCPPVGEVHGYILKIWALSVEDLRSDTTINFESGTSIVEGIDRVDVSSATFSRNFTGPP